jgi:hypothetical protein
MNPKTKLEKQKPSPVTEERKIKHIHEEECTHLLNSLTAVGAL